HITFTGAGTLNLGGDFTHAGGPFTAGPGTVNYTGSDAQIVAGVTYNQLVFNKPSGVATLESAATVNGDLTLTNGGNFRLNAPLVVAGGVMLRTNTTLNLNNQSVSLGGDWVCDGATLDVANGGEVALNGTGAQTIFGMCAFHNLGIRKPSGTATLAGNISVGLDLDLAGGTLNLSTHTITANSSGAALIAAAGTTLRTPGSFPVGFNTIALDPASTVEYYGSSNQTVAAATYGQLIVTNGDSNPKTLAGPIAVTGNLVIGDNATLAASANSLTLLGNWTNRGAFTAGTGTVILGGTNQTVAGATTFNNLTIPGSYTVADCDIHISGDVTILGSYAAGSGTHTLDGNLHNDGVMSSTGITTFTGTRLQLIELLTPIQSVSSGVVNFNGTVSPVLNSTASPRFANVNINNTGGVTASVGWTVYFQFNVGAGAGFNGNGFVHTFYGPVTNNGTMTGGGTLNFSPAADTTLALGNFSSSGIVVFGGARRITLASGALALGSVEIANTHAAGLTPVANWTLAGDLLVDGGAVFHAGPALTHTIAGDFNNNGTLDGGTSLMVFNGTSEITGGGATVFNHLLVSGSLTNLADISVTGSFTNNGAFDASGANVSFTGSSPSFIAGSTTPTSIDSLVIAKNSSTNTVTLAVNVANLTSLTVSSGVFDTSAYTVSEDAVNTGALSVNSGSTLRLGGSSSFPTFTGGATLNSGSTVEYSGGAQTVAAQTYANLKLSGSGNKTLGSAITINGNVDIGGTAKFNLTNNRNSTVGSLSYAGVLQPQNNTYGSTSSSAASKTDTYFQGNGMLTVGSILMDHFAVTVSGTPIAKSSFTIAITAQDANDNTVPTFTNLVGMTETGNGAGGTVSPTNSATFTAGVLASQSVTLSKAGALVTISVTGTNAGTNYTGVSDPFTVNPATPDLSWATPTNIVYGTALGTNQNNATSSLPGTFAYNPTNGTVLPAGTNTLRVTFTPTDTDYSNRTMTVSLVVTPAPLGITANSTNRIYGVTNPAFTYTASGFVNGDTASVLTGAPVLTTSVTTNSPVGNYVITNTAGTLTATNYTLTFTNGTLTVNPRPVALAGSRAYDGTTNAAYSLLTVTNIFGSDNLTLTSGTVGLASPNVGARAITSFGALVLGGTAATNYTVTGATGSVTLTNTPLTITANNDSKIYGSVKTYGAGSTAFASGGLRNGETIGSVTITAGGGTAANAPAGNYTLTPSAATGGTFATTNYSITYVNGTLTVIPLNVAPGFTKGTNVVVPMNASPQTIAGWASNISAGPTNESAQTLVFNVSSDNPALFSVPPAIGTNGTLTFTLATGLGGIATVTVNLQDSGGTVNGGVDTSANQTFTILVAAYSIGNRVFADPDNDGARGWDYGETGIGGVRMLLFTNSAGNPSGGILAAIDTDSSGNYRFDNLPPGSYVVVADQPSSSSLTGYASSTGNSTDLTLIGQLKDHGLDTPVTILNQVTNGIAGVPVTVGYGLQPTNEVVGNAPGMGRNGPCGDAYDNLVVDFSFTPTHSLGNRVFLDDGTGGGTANNGIQDGTEPGIANVAVKLFAADVSGNPTGAELASTNTDASGYYRFDNLVAAAYVVVVDQNNSANLSGLVTSTGASADLTATGDAKDHGKDAPVTVLGSVTNGIASSAVTLGVGLQPTSEATASGAGANGSNGDASDNLAVDFGFAPAYSLGNRVFLDDGAGGGTANNGIQDGSEPGIADVNLHLYAADMSGNPTGSILMETDTDSGGYYRFDAVPAGTYVVVIDPVASASVLNGLQASAVSNTDNTLTGDAHSHGQGTPLGTGSVLPGGIAGNAITVGAGSQPTGEANGAGAGANGPTGDAGDNGEIALPVEKMHARAE
ncbi:MAG: MBG domain-containing protein, partial [Verrucomicrobia bacterium]|nr:MBG domain-containing protein [Verrucomicrobiota bacterium]